MSKGKGFFSNLNKSTRITLISCGCFIALAVVILSFFVMFPVTPSEKVISSFGREKIIKENGASTTTVTTGMNGSQTSKSTRLTTTVSRTTRTNYTIKVTSGSGYFVDQRIPTGVYPNQYFSNPTTTVTVAGGGSGSSEYPSGGGTGSGAGSGAGGEIPVTPTEGGSGSGTGAEIPDTPTEGGSGSGTGSGTGGDVPPADAGSDAASVQ